MDDLSEAEVVAVGNYADLLFRNGWTVEALRYYQMLFQCGAAVDQDKARRVLEAYRQIDPLRQSMGRHQPLAVMKHHQIFSSLHFSDDLTEHQKRVAFKSGVGFINVETSSQCNRACAYCPNSKYDRRGGNAFMDAAVYESILDQLASISYDGWFCLVGLNEPLMHRDDLLMRLETARRKIPCSHLVVFSNGDFLDKATFQALESAGLNELRISIHLSAGKTYNERDVLKRILDKARELGLLAVLDDYASDKHLDFSLHGSKMRVLMFEKNYMTQGHNRGGVMAGVGVPIQRRSEPCIMPFDNFIVNYSGDVLPCCTLIGSSPEVQPWIVGNVANESIFDIYCSKKMAAWRRDNMAEGEKRPPCDTCPEILPGFPGNWSEVCAKAMAAAQHPVDGVPACDP